MYTVKYKTLFLYENNLTVERDEKTNFFCLIEAKRFAADIKRNIGIKIDHLWTYSSFDGIYELVEKRIDENE